MNSAPFRCGPSVLCLLTCVAAVSLALGSTQVRAQAPPTNGDQGQVTFTKDVLPILQQRCQECHRPGSIAPMSLLTYEEARPWARAMKARVVAREMPPWHLDRRVGIRKFKDDPSLTDREIAAIARWVDSGAPMGNPADAPPPRQFTARDQWRIGEPDLIVTTTEPYIVAAEGPDTFPNFELDPQLTEDRYIKAVEVKPAPNTHKVVHHVATHMTEYDDNIVRGNFLNEYAIGKNGDIFDEGTGRLIKAGTKIRMGVHFHPYGVETPAKLSLGLRFYPKGYVPKYVLVSQHMGDNDDLDIPAGDNDVRHDGYTLLTKPAVITSFQPHLHNRGKAQCMEAVIPPTKPDGSPVTDGPAPLMRTQTLSCVQKWDFNWHIVYNYAEDVAPVLPAGTVIHVTSWHDNSAASKFNPDPQNNIVYGQRTVDDMAFAWVSYYYLDDEEHKARLAARKAKGTDN